MVPLKRGLLSGALALSLCVGNLHPLRVELFAHGLNLVGGRLRLLVGDPRLRDAPTGDDEPDERR
jgi:hypothetical protein